ncbi:MAG: hypothetical protein HP492_14235 [Nitrospira sp.]|nr:hypothetical protein [Nitrospira sp.]
MFTRLLLVLIIALSQVGCPVEEEVGLYQPYPLTLQARVEFERFKRESLKIEDIKIGEGPVAALGRKVTADIEVRYADGNGQPIYRGPAINYFGMQGYAFIHDSLREDGLLSTQQRGIILGLNGMAVGGKRRLTIQPKLVCEGYGTEEANPNVSCLLVIQDRLHGGNIKVRKETLIVEATLTESCIPGLSVGPIWKREIRCRDSDVPRRDPTDPIWHIYEAPPSSP